MHFGDRFAHAGAMRGVRPPRPHASEKVDDRRGTARELAIDLALAIPRRLRTTHTALGQMRHQRKEVRQVIHRHALFVEREDERALAGMQQEVGILDALGDALVGEQLADVVAFQELREVFSGDVGVNRHRDYSAAASGRSERGSGKNSFSSAADTVSTCNSKRSAKAPMISSTITSGADAPAVMPR